MRKSKRELESTLVKYPMFAYIINVWYLQRLVRIEYVIQKELLSTTFSTFGTSLHMVVETGSY